MHCIRSLIILWSEIHNIRSLQFLLSSILSFLPFRHKLIHVSLCVVQDWNLCISIFYRNKKTLQNPHNEVVKGSFTSLVVPIIYLIYDYDYRKDNKKESIMTSLQIANNYNFMEKIGFEGYCKWKQISLFLFSLTLQFPCPL